MRKHGLTNHKLFAVWSSAIDRCHNPNAQAYPNYGARGITVCDEWRAAFLPFYEWAMENGWKPGLQIDRRDNDEGYFPGNTRFVTAIVNQRNRRNNRRLTFNGETKCLIEWAEQRGIKKTTLKERLNRGWSVEDALTKDLIPKTAKTKDCVNRKGRPIYSAQ